MPQISELRAEYQVGKYGYRYSGPTVPKRTSKTPVHRPKLLVSSLVVVRHYERGREIPR